MEKEKKVKRNFFKKVYLVVKRIPQGKVATYGQIAEILGKPHWARVVGWALHVNRDKKVPCHRVVDKEGRLATTFGLGGWQEQKRRLKAEGVTFIDEKQVNLEKHLWRQ